MSTTLQMVVDQVKRLDEFKVMEDRQAKNVKYAMKDFLDCAEFVFGSFPRDGFFAADWAGDVCQSDWRGEAGPLVPDKDGCGQLSPKMVAALAAMSNAPHNDGFLMLQLSAFSKVMACWAAAIGLIKFTEDTDIDEKTIIVVQHGMRTLSQLMELMEIEIARYEKENGMTFTHKDFRMRCFRCRLPCFQHKASASHRTACKFFPEPPSDDAQTQTSLSVRSLSSQRKSRIRHKATPSVSHAMRRVSGLHPASLHRCSMAHFARTSRRPSIVARST